MKTDSSAVTSQDQARRKMSCDIKNSRITDGLKVLLQNPPLHLLWSGCHGLFLGIGLRFLNNSRKSILYSLRVSTAAELSKLVSVFITYQLINNQEQKQMGKTNFWAKLICKVLLEISYVLA